ncbi:mannitol dehydrogenase family protein [Flavimaricola marinus]|uniref:Mannitol 2-dehydrogenase n=1 Tax=Flavimaricola marinus TaxID=1819565 RepID=A0A238LIG5_9RHOB|nr:mannitol dehydrogenase family protein [Flavimaricola marinus]SMY09195.1 Mannitol 2-dehydrogenase [Flavimaricola marinus]
MVLNLKTLNDLPEGVRKPGYDRADLTAGIVHIGLGNFHRAHQAWYSHRLMDQGLALDWAILGAGVRPADDAQRTKMLEQDCLTTLIELDPSGKSAEITGAMIGYIPVAADNAPLIAHMAEAAIRIVSMTVTEGGYYQTAGGTLDTEHPDIRHDAENPGAPRTAFGAMIAALRLRRDAGLGPFTCLSCDNLQGNGDILKRTILGLASLSDPALSGWIDQNASFPNSMVDCIVPATGPTELALVREFGVEDNVPVTHEPFRQWVIEDTFCAGRPDWDKVGATFTSDVHSFEAMKLRQLNAGHQVIATPGELLSVETIAGTMAHPLIGGLLRKIEVEEIVPHVAAVPGMTPLAYVDLIERRFGNPEIRDTTRRVAFDGSSRHSGFLHPIIRDALAAGTPIEGLALVEALWARMCAGTREDGSSIAPNDPFWDTLTKHAALAKDDPSQWLSQTQFYGDLGQDDRFAAAFDRWLRLVWDQGTESALQTYLDG